MRIDIIKDKSEARYRLLQQISNHDERGIKNQEFLSYLIINTSLLVLPCTKLEFIKHLKRAIGSIYEEGEIEEFINRHIGHQDMVEILDQNPHEKMPKTKLFPTPPRYIKSHNQRYFLIGIGIEDPSVGHGDLMIGSEQRTLLDNLRYSKHLRFWDTQDFESEKELESILFKCSIAETQTSEWIDDFFVEENYYSSPQSFIDKINTSLNNQDFRQRSLINGEFLDSNLPSNNYARRWKDVSNAIDGRYILRAGERYETVYRYAEINQGNVTRELNFDQIWNQQIRDHKSIALMIQMAIDFLNGKHQLYFIEPTDNDSFVLKLNHLVPDWVQKNLISYGKPGPERTKGDHYLLSFEIDNLMEEEVHRMLNKYWLKKKD